ncbi:MAG: hypothetical protein HY975_03635 [Candidatus Kerfeldbacteria bacterium]|nr:hypothetical protein [Candidatus Kerfeldbacteria bacterium]
MTSHINIGLRHIFPFYVFLSLTAGSICATLARRRASWLPVTATLIIGVSALVAINAWPNTLGYFNRLVGGTTNGHAYVLDSNLDWNQDIWRLRTFLQQHGFTSVHLALFGSIPADKVFPGRLPVLTDEDVDRGVQPTGLVVISAGQLYNEDGPFHWLRSYTPNWRVGSSITVYDFR